MFALYLFALVVGGGLLVASLAGSDHHGGDLGHHDIDHGGATQWLSLRTLTYFLFVFGGVGAVLSKSWHAAAAPLVLGLAAVAGLAVGSMASLVFGYLRRTESGARESDDSFIGLRGRITLPIAPGGAGKVQVARGDRMFELLARAYERASGPPSDWRTVIVVEMDRGVARVAPIDDPSVQELVSLTSS